MICTAGTFYTMKADIYIPHKAQNELGMVESAWTYSETINCSAKTILRDTLLSGSNSIDIAGMYVQAIDIIKIRSSLPIDPKTRVTNIRNKDDVIWTESSTISTDGGINGATIFEPRGSTPIINFDGSVLEYETLLQKQEVQKLVVE